MNREELNLYREYGWNYFSLHAEQRLKTFHFYIALSTLIYGGMFTILKDAISIMNVMPVLCLQTFLSFIFWKLDQRNRDLIKHGENFIKSIEKIVTDNSNGSEEMVHLFMSEEAKSHDKKRFLNFRCSYSICFNWVFLVFGFAGWAISYLVVT